MGLSSPFAGPGRPRKLLFLSALLAANMGSAGCGPGRQVALPPPRPIVVTSGERLRVDAARMDSVYEWLVAENLNIQEDPTFMIRGVPTARETLPWLTMTIEGDTARIQYDRAHPDITTAFNVYAHLHLMKNVGRLDEWLPDHAGDEGFELERAIVARMADAWLLGRAVFDVPAYGPLDELVYAKEAGYLDPFLLVARGDEFVPERAAWEQDKPGELDTYRAWFRKVFDREPLGLRETTGDQRR